MTRESGEENLQPEPKPEKKVGMTPEELAVAKAKMDEFEYVGGKFVKKGSESHKKATEQKMEEEKAKQIEELRQEIGESQLEKEKRELLEEMDKRGILASYSSISHDLAAKKNSSTGFQLVFNKEEPVRKFGYDLRDTLTGSRDFEYDLNLRDILGENQEGINAAVTIKPFKEIMGKKKVTETSGWWPFKTTNSHYVVEKVFGDGENPIPIGALNGNNQDKEATYKITYLLTGNKKKGGYQEGPGTRFGNMFYGHFLIPESLAKKAFELIEDNPSFVKDMIRKMDPDVMGAQEKIMPKVDKIIIIPEGEATKALVKGKERHISEINPKYVKECPEY